MDSFELCKICYVRNECDQSDSNYLCMALDALQALLGCQIPMADVVMCVKCAKKVANVRRFIEVLRERFSCPTLVDSDVPLVTANGDYKMPSDEGPTEDVPATIKPALVCREIRPKTECQQPMEAKVENVSSMVDLRKKPTQRLYRCMECEKIFNAHRQLKAHQEKHKQTRILNVCEYCSSLYGDAEALAAHIAAEHTDKKYKCLCCAKWCSSRGRLLQHLGVHCYETLIYKCKLCAATTNEEPQGTTSEDQQTTTNEDPDQGTTTTSDTTTTYVGFAELEQHYQTAHAPTAAEQTLSSDDADMEIKAEFLDELWLGDSENSLQFSEWEAFDLHLPDMLSVGSSDGGAYSCPKCYKDCATQRALLLHLAGEHELPVLNCNKCEANFSDVDEFRHHKRTHSSAPASTSAEHGEQRPPDCQYQCGVCDRTFRSNAALIYHVKTHSRTAVRPHKCPYCAKQFHTNVNLKQHLRIVHVRVKLKACQHCDAHFVTLDHLKKHMASRHGTDRKHVCPTCGRCFALLYHLKQHRRIHERHQMKTTTGDGLRKERPS